MNILLENLNYIIHFYNLASPMTHLELAKQSCKIGLYIWYPLQFFGG